MHMHEYISVHEDGRPGVFEPHALGHGGVSLCTTEAMTDSMQSCCERRQWVHVSRIRSEMECADKARAETESRLHFKSFMVRGRHERASGCGSIVFLGHAANKSGSKLLQDHSLSYHLTWTANLTQTQEAFHSNDDTKQRGDSCADKTDRHYKNTLTPVSCFKMFMRTKWNWLVKVYRKGCVWQRKWCRRGLY